MLTKKLGSKPLTKDQEERFGDSLRRVLISEYPNPNREGCPDPKTIRDLAFHKNLGDPQAFEQVADHVARCSACVRDALGYVEEYKEKSKRHRRIQLAFALAAGLVIGAAIWAMWRNQPKQEMVVAPRPSQTAPLVADNSNRQPGIGFEMTTIELPSRWRGVTSPEHPIFLNHGRLQLEIRFPIGSSDGKYHLRILDKSGKVRTNAEGTAHTQNGITSLKVALDTSDLSSGDYKLSILEPGIDEWAEYPIGVK